MSHFATPISYRLFVIHPVEITLINLVSVEHKRSVFPSISSQIIKNFPRTFQPSFKLLIPHTITQNFQYLYQSNHILIRLGSITAVLCPSSGKQVPSIVDLLALPANKLCLSMAAALHLKCMSPRTALPASNAEPVFLV